jgi:hypothetical protein
MGAWHQQPLCPLVFRHSTLILRHPEVRVPISGSATADLHGAPRRMIGRPSSTFALSNASVTLRGSAGPSPASHLRVRPDRCSQVDRWRRSSLEQGSERLVDAHVVEVRASGPRARAAELQRVGRGLMRVEGLLIRPDGNHLVMVYARTRLLIDIVT